MNRIVFFFFVIKREILDGELVLESTFPEFDTSLDTPCY